MTEKTNTENISINWDNSEERARLVERIGIEAYNAAFSKHIEKSTVAVVAGHPICPIKTRFGKLWKVGNTGRAFKTLEKAETYARNNPA